ncbi:MAG: hypothetical protein ABI699_08545 [Caldimonas sp.]
MLAGVLASAAFAKLPPLSDEAKAKAAEAAVKSAWTDKVGLYKVCQAMDRAAETYRAQVKASGGAASAPDPTPPCTDPGPFVAPVAEAAKPLEAAGAHSPPAMATSPPSGKATSAEITGTRK